VAAANQLSPGNLSTAEKEIVAKFRSQDAIKTKI
jgi:hypothetical protein